MAKVLKELPADDNRKTYILAVGKHFGRNEKGEVVEYEVGDEVLLTDEQYESFRDKFEAPEATQNRIEHAQRLAQRRAQATQVKLPTEEESLPEGYDAEEGVVAGKGSTQQSSQSAPAGTEDSKAAPVGTGNAPGKGTNTATVGADAGKATGAKSGDVKVGADADKK
jgi:hypothetical protein